MLSLLYSAFKNMAEPQKEAVGVGEVTKGVPWTAKVPLCRSRNVGQSVLAPWDLSALSLGLSFQVQRPLQQQWEASLPLSHFCPALTQAN